MSDLVRNPEDWFSHIAAHLYQGYNQKIFKFYAQTANIAKFVSSNDKKGHAITYKLLITLRMCGWYAMCILFHFFSQNRYVSDFLNVNLNLHFFLYLRFMVGKH